jgi:TonB family protein
VIAEAWAIGPRIALVATFACALVLLVRVPLRNAFGARVAYAAWLVVPVILVAALLPAPTASPTQGLRALALAADPGSMTAVAAFDPRPWLLFAWLTGVAVTAMVFSAQQRRYVRSLGQVRRMGARVIRTASGEGAPALVGAWRARVVVPADFVGHYDARERRLILAHEREHLVRGDALVNAVVVALQCLHWFNPVVHLAAARFRYDQELACDAAVIERFPGARAAYAGAMLKTQLAVQARQEFRLPVGCRWPSRHPFKERLLMLKKGRPSRALRAAGILFVAAFGCGGGYAAWAAQTPRTGGSSDPGAEQVDAHLSIALGDSAVSNLRLVARLGEVFSVDSGSDANAWHGDFVATRDPKGIALVTTFTRSGRVIAKPLLVVAEGKPGFIDIGEHDSPDHLHLDSTLFVHPADWRISAPSGATRPAAEDVTFRMMFPPTYPAEAIAARQQGHLDLLVDFDEHGQPRKVAVAKADPPEAEGGLGESAIAAVRKWSFNPALVDGRAVASTILVPIDYRLSDDD